MKVFRCKRCGNCCRGESTVSLSPKDILAISKFLNIPEEEFLEKFTVKKYPNRIEMKTKNGFCVFFDEKKKECKIHPVKPEMCKKWPLIPAIFEDVDTFKVISQVCEGLKDFTWKELKKSRDFYLRDLK